MKKWSKKLLTVIMAFILVLSLAGCKKDNNTQTVNQPDSTPTVAPETTEPTKGETESVDEIYPAFDMQKRTIKVGIWWDMYYTSEHNDITDNPGLTNTETAQMMLDNVRRIEEKYNVRIEFVNLGWEGITESINTSIMAGTPECDIYLADLQFGIPAVINGLAQDLTKIASPNSDMFHDQKVIKPLDALGGTYLFSEQGLPQNGIFLGYNGTMIQELGLEDPQELYKQGKWTWDKFAELAKAGTRDTNGDGTVDVYGFGGVFIDLINGLNMNNGGSLAGNPTEGLSTKPVIESLEFINRLYNVDQSARPWNTEDWNDNYFAWSDGKVMFWTAQGWSLKQEADAAIAEGAELPFDYHVVPYPSGPSGDGKAYSPVSGNWYFVPVGVQEPEKVLQVFEEYLNWHGGDSEYRDDPSWFESCFQTEEDLEMAYITGANLKLDPWSSLTSFDFGSNIWNPIVVDKNATVAQSVESSKQVLQDALDTFYGANKE